jgi:pimeloyl-ACP methyl ester carboxylesterase
MFTNYLEIENDIRIFYKVYGSTREAEGEINTNQPTLIFLHGGPGVVDHSLYVPFWSKFSGKEMMGSGLQVIFIDHRGCGRSFYDKDGVRDYGDSSRWNLPQWGKDVHTFFKTLGIRKPIIAGVSFGGVVAMSCAVQFPTELGGLILSDTDARFDLEEVLLHFTGKVKSKGGDEQEVTRVHKAARKMFTETTAETYENYVRLCMPYCAANPYNAKLISECVKNEAVAYLYNRNELTKFNFLPELKKVECQVLIISGDRNPVHTAESAKRTAAAIQPDKLNFKIFSGAGSPVYADRENEVIALINQYLDKLSWDLQEEKSSEIGSSGCSYASKN